MENQNTNPQKPTPNPVSTPTQPTGPKISSQTSVKPVRKIPKALIFGVLAFLILAGAGFAFKDQVMKMVSKPTPTPAPQAIAPSPTTDPTANWETYKGKYFSISYPSNLDLVFTEGTPELKLKEKYILTMPIFSSTENTSLKQYLLSEYENSLKNTGLPSYKQNMKAFKEFTLDGTTGIKLISNVESNSETKNLVYIKKGKNVFLFFNSDDDEKELFDQILSTFKFTDSTSSNTYTNKTLGFSLNLPDLYGVLKEETGKVVIGYKKENIGYLTISNTNLTNYKTIKLCTQVAEGTTEKCIDDNNGWNQKEPIEKIKLDGLDAVSLYLTAPGDFAQHIVQTTTSTPIELNMNVAGGGLEGTFQQILSTFKFTE